MRNKKHPLRHMHRRRFLRWTTGAVAVGIVTHGFWKALRDWLTPKRPPYGGTDGGSDTSDG